MHNIFKAVSPARSSVQRAPLPLIGKTVLTQATGKHLIKKRGSHQNNHDFPHQSELVSQVHWVDPAVDV